MPTKNRFVDPRNSRGTHQDRIYQEIVDAGEDPFTYDNLKKYHNGPIIFENFSWFVIENQWPYKMTKHHFVIILREYEENFDELTEIQLIDLQKVMKWLKQEYGIKGGGLGFGAIVARTGDTEFTGATVKHLHCHFIVPDVDHPDYGPDNRVNVVLGGNKTKPETN